MQRAEQPAQPLLELGARLLVDHLGLGRLHLAGLDLALELGDLVATAHGMPRVGRAQDAAADNRDPHEGRGNPPRASVPQCPDVGHGNSKLTIGIDQYARLTEWT